MSTANHFPAAIASCLTISWVLSNRYFSNTLYPIFQRQVPLSPHAPTAAACFPHAWVRHLGPRTLAWPSQAAWKCGPGSLPPPLGTSMCPRHQEDAGQPISMHLSTSCTQRRGTHSCMLQPYHACPQTPWMPARHCPSHPDHAPCATGRCRVYLLWPWPPLVWGALTHPRDPQ